MLERQWILKRFGDPAHVSKRERSDVPMPHSPCKVHVRPRKSRATPAACRAGLPSARFRPRTACAPHARSGTAVASALPRHRPARALHASQGPREQDQFLAYVDARLHDRRLESLVKNLFRPNYGGNRNYTLDGLMVSSYDMRPSTLVKHSPDSPVENEISRGRRARGWAASGATAHMISLASVRCKRVADSSRTAV
jgi:hypothetical protein